MMMLLQEAGESALEDPEATAQLFVTVVLGTLLFFSALAFAVSLIKALRGGHSAWKVISAISGLATLMLLAVGGLLWTVQRGLEERALHEEHWHDHEFLHEEVALTLPPGWMRRSDFYEDSVFEASSRRRDWCLSVFTLPRHEYAYGDLESYADWYADHYLAEEDTRQVSRDDSRVGGYPAIQVELEVPGERDPLTMLLVLIESDEAYHCVLCWCPLEERDEGLPVLKEIARTFELREPDTFNGESYRHLPELTPDGDVPHEYFELPDDWSSMEDLNSEASVEVGNEAREEYLILLTDWKYEFEGSLEEHVDITTEKLLQTGTEKRVVSRRAVDIAGHDAIQVELFRAFEDGQRICYLQSTLETDAGYHQILCWTQEKNRTIAFARFAQILETFDEFPD